MKAILLLLAGVACIACGVVFAADGPGASGGYSNDFEKSEVGKSPDDVMILDAAFAVREVDGNKCLELAGDPIGSFGALFGPAETGATEVKARIWAASAGKRFPEFGIGAGDAGGYKLLALPGGHVVELRKGDDAIASAPYEWSSGSWTWFRLDVEWKDKGGCVVRGKLWPQGSKEPETWTVSAPDADAPPAGKASIWGNDFSEEPIRFDDLTVTPKR